MISRRSAVRLELLFEFVFTIVDEPGYLEHFDFDALWEFLYEEEVEGWFLNGLKNAKTAPAFKDMVLGLHTGASLFGSLTMEAKKQIGQTILMQMTNAILKFQGPDLDNPVPKEEDGLILTRALLRQLEVDGYIYRNGKLSPSESTVIPEEEEQSYLEQLISDLHLSDIATIRHHLTLSEEHFLNGKWDDSISNSRKVLDAIIKQITETLYSRIEGKPAPAGLLKNAQQTREYLEKQDIVTRPEREALDRAYGVLSVTGGHPYIAEKDQARLMRHLALTFSQFVLLRYQGFFKTHP